GSPDRHLGEVQGRAAGGEYCRPAALGLGERFPDSNHSRRHSGARPADPGLAQAQHFAMIKPWVFEFLPELGGPSVEPDPRDVATLFARYLDLWVRDETLGFEGIFFSEHHFGRSYSASPNLLIAAIASRTRTLRLGVMGVVLPYYHPARVV